MACDFELPPRIKLDHGAVTNSAETSGDSRGTGCTGGNTGKKGMDASNYRWPVGVYSTAGVPTAASYRSTLDGV